MELLIDRLDSPVGEIFIATTPRRLVLLEFLGDEARMRASLAARYPDHRFRDADDPLGATSRLAAYFGGELTALDELPVETGGTSFQEEVWRMLRTIPVGATASYGQIAAQLGRPGASRAVGLANSLNPVAIVLPCHRVIGADGSLTGYAGGLDRKRWLLRHEGAPIGAKGALRLEL